MLLTLIESSHQRRQVRSTAPLQPLHPGHDTRRGAEFYSTQGPVDRSPGRDPWNLGMAAFLNSLMNPQFPWQRVAVQGSPACASFNQAQPLNFTASSSIELQKASRPRPIS